MSSLALSFKTPYLEAPGGLAVEAWDASDFVSFPTNPAAYPPNASAVASGITDASGNCTLTGLTSGHSYYVSIVDVGAEPHFFDATGYVAAGTLLCRYQSSPPAVPNPNWGPLFQVGSFGTVNLTSTLGDLGWSNVPDFNTDPAAWGNPTYTIQRSGIYLVTISAMVAGNAITTAPTSLLMSDGYVNAGGGPAQAKTSYTVLPPYPGSGVPGDIWTGLVTALYKCAAGDTFTPQAAAAAPAAAQGAGQGTWSILGPLPS